MARLKHTPGVTGHYTHNGERYRIEDGVIEVDDPQVARELAENRRIELIDETHYCGVNGCSREVDSPEETCWQH